MEWGLAAPVDRAVAVADVNTVANVEAVDHAETVALTHAERYGGWHCDAGTQSNTEAKSDSSAQPDAETIANTYGNL